MSNHCISNHLEHPLLNLYLDNSAIIHPGLDGNDVVHNLDSTKRSVLLDPRALPRQPFSILCHHSKSKHRPMENRVLYFLLFLSDHSLALNSLSNHFQFTFSANFLSICLLQYFIGKLVNACVIAAKPVVFTINFEIFIVTIKIFTNFVKPIVTTITLFLQRTLTL